MQRRIFLLIIIIIFLSLLGFGLLKHNGKFQEEDINLADTSSVIGDVNGDKKVSAADYILIKKFIMKKSSLTSAQQKLADANGDGKITSADYVLVKKAIMNGSSLNPSGSTTPTDKIVYQNNKAKILDLGDSYEIINHNVLDYGADKTGNNDSTDAFIKAINAAKECTNVSKNNKCGSIIYVPKGRYKLTKTLTLPAYVELVGELKEGTTDGTVLYISHNKGNVKATNSAIIMEAMSSVKNIAFYYPDQSVDASGNVSKYPPTIAFGGPGCNGSSIENVNFVNSYTAMDFSSELRINSSIFFVRNVYGTPLYIGLVNDNNLDTIKMDNINFSPKYWLNSGLGNIPSSANLNKALKNGSLRPCGILFERVDWFFLANINISGYYYGINLVRSEPPANVEGPYGGNSEGELFDSKITDCIYPVNVSNSRHVVITNSTLSSSGGRAFNVPSGIDTSYSIYGSNITSSGDASIYYAGNGGVSVTNSSVAGKITKTNSGAKLSLVGNELSGTGMDGCDINANLTTASISGYAKKVTAKPKSKNIIMIEANNGSDITRAIKEAINKLKSIGGIVYIPNGTFVLSDHIDVSSGIEIRGSTSWAHDSTLGGTTVLKTSYKGDTLFTLQSSSGLDGFTIIYPDNWETLENPVAYPYTIKGNGSNIYIKNITLPAVWNGIDLASTRCDNHYLEHIWGEFYNIGINVGAGSSNGIIRNSHFTINVLNNTHDGAKKLARTNQTVFKIGSSSNETLFHIFTFGPQLAYSFEGASNFKAIGIGADASGTGINISRGSTGQIINPMMVSRSYDNFYGTSPANSRYIRSSSDFSGKVDIINSINWGNSKAVSFEFAGTGDLHIYSGIIENSHDPTIKTSNSAATIAGLVLADTRVTKKLQIDNGAKNINMLGTICQGISGCASGVTNSAGASFGNQDPKTTCDSTPSAPKNWQALSLKNTSVTSKTGTTTICNIEGGYSKLEYSTNNDGVKSANISGGCATITISALGNQVLSYRLVGNSSTSWFRVERIGKYLILAQVYNYLLYVNSQAPNDASNLSFWAGKTNDLSENVKSIGNTAVNQNKNASNDTFVRYAYRGILGRDADAGGLSHWVNKLNSGTSRNDIISSFVVSDEARAIYNAWGYK